MNRAIVLYSRLQPFLRYGLQAANDQFGWQFDVVTIGEDSQIPSGLSSEAAIRLCEDRHLPQFRSDIAAGKFAAMLVSGWRYAHYLKMAKLQRRAGRASVLIFDDPWRGRLKQRLGQLYGRAVLRPIFSHAWVAGIEQYEFARRLGFASDRIHTDLILTDSTLFDTPQSRQRPPNPIENLLYVGRLSAAKGAEELLAGLALHLRRKPSSPLRLTICGAEPQPVPKELDGRIDWRGVLPHHQLPPVMAECDALILVGRDEHWGTVVQEAAAASLPLILSDRVGARHRFGLDNYNAIICRHRDATSVADAVESALSLTKEQVALMRRRSRELAYAATPQQWASRLHSIAQTSLTAT